MALKKVADTYELDSDGERTITEINGREIAVFWLEDEFHAVSNFCVHRADPLCEGGLMRETNIGEDGWEWVSVDYKPKQISCPVHGWRVDSTTGVCPDDDQYRVPTYHAVVEDNEIYVDL